MMPKIVLIRSSKTKKKVILVDVVDLMKLVMGTRIVNASKKYWSRIKILKGTMALCQ